MRPFEAGRDEAAWVALNAAAFASHPEQGAFTTADLSRRLTRTWFRPGDLIMAEPQDDADPSAPEGYVWVKLEGTDQRVGEIYAIGVHPQAQGRGLGAKLLEAGLRRLAARGAREAILYVEGNNTGALRLYRRFGFKPETTHVQYAWHLGHDGGLCGPRQRVASPI
jgi:mycothiol synthase